MKKDIILAGVGGQGILSIAATIGLAAIEARVCT
jgi:Pyruvate/2-oxoacid:ferredoxin oxidoreductase gamma subunit